MMEDSLGSGKIGEGSGQESFRKEAVTLKGIEDVGEQASPFSEGKP